MVTCHGACRLSGRPLSLSLSPSPFLLSGASWYVPRRSDSLDGEPREGAGP